MSRSIQDARVRIGPNVMLCFAGPTHGARLETIEDVVRNAQWRSKRVVVFFYALGLCAIALGVVVDAQPPRPHLECHQSTAQVHSHYPHPYGLPPPVTWTSCVWK